MNHPSALASPKLVQLIQSGIEEELLRPHPNPLWARLREVGTEPWLDTGDMDEAARLWSAEFTALTTNNSLLNKEIQKGIYDQWIPTAAAAVRADKPDISDHDLILEIAFGLNARHGLRLVEKFGAYVSVELHTDLAYDVERSLAYGRRYAAICNKFIVKVPLTPEGLVVARNLEEEGIPVNFTLGFSARENYLITCAARPSWCNVFLGRLGAYAAGEGLGDGQWVGERAHMASQAAVRELRAKIGAPTRQIAASMRNGEQVATLAGTDVYTMPIAVAEGFLASNPSPGDLHDETDADYQPMWNDGIDPQAEGMNDLWNITPSFRQACDAIAKISVEDLNADVIRATLVGAGCGAVFPQLNGTQLQTLIDEGKAPKRATWSADIAAGTFGLDALFTLAGLHAFAQDQAALDARIREQLS
ncbi:MAG: transaldolase [Planctomycetes bacterium]|nr:transaldolase [Planctomycetota bacterium]